MFFFFFKQKTAYEMRISDWSSDVCSSDLCLGGNGYVEEGLAARLYRELPLNAIWEGSGNVMCLDLLRVLEQDPAAVEGVLDALGQAASGERRLETALRELRALLRSEERRVGKACVSTCRSWWSPEQ